MEENLDLKSPNSNVTKALSIASALLLFFEIVCYGFLLLIGMSEEIQPHFESFTTTIFVVAQFFYIVSLILMIALRVYDKKNIVGLILMVIHIVWFIMKFLFICGCLIFLIATVGILIYAINECAQSMGCFFGIFGLT